jgi:hypothetical protein
VWNAPIPQEVLEFMLEDETADVVPTEEGEVALVSLSEG